MSLYLFPDELHARLAEKNHVKASIKWQFNAHASSYRDGLSTTQNIFSDCTGLSPALAMAATFLCHVSNRRISCIWYYGPPSGSHGVRFESSPSRETVVNGVTSLSGLINMRACMRSGRPRTVRIERLVSHHHMFNSPMNENKSK